MPGVAAGKSFGAVADGFDDHRVVFPEPVGFPVSAKVAGLVIGRR
jgi:hypothetical protein